MNDDNQTNSPEPAFLPMSWEELRSSVTAVGDGLYIATVDERDRPHVAFVQPGWTDHSLLIGTFATSQKAKNLRHNASAAFTCAPSPAMNLLVRGNARLVDDPAENERLWNSGVFPYDLGEFFSGPNDPLTLFIEFTPMSASIATLWPSPPRRWTP